jgi:hypothetical protein
MQRNNSVFSIAIAKAKTRKKNRIESVDPDEPGSLQNEFSKASLGVIMAISLLVGTGAIICLANGLIKAGNPLDFIWSWLNAVIGK